MLYTSYPALHNHIAFKIMLEYLGAEFIEPPEFTEDMIKYGNKRSPEYSCVPFKFYLAMFREAAKHGIDGAFIYGARNMRACRYDDLRKGIEKILKDEGLNFKLVTWGGYGAKKSFEQLKSATANPSFLKMLKAILLFTKMLDATDKVDDLANFMRPRERKEESVDEWLDASMDKFKQAKIGRDIKMVLKQSIDEAKKIGLDENRKILEVAVIGDVFKIHEPFMHFDTIRKLAKLGVHAKQSQPFHRIFRGGNKFPLPKKERFSYLQKKARKYIRSLPASYIDIGIGEAILACEEGANGIIHFQTFGCMPDIMMKPILAKVAKDYKIPIMHYMRDTHSSDEGYKTRLEAFVDLINRKNSNANS
ncbi:MAG: hypothetical protein ACD_11C00149G0002 [uncultured bacterium]|nr:MAG: hypothetical protein ACD_11C00149G0002 [uncultured bacterium]